MSDFQVGDIVRLKKGHPCGSDQWKITRIGMDFRMKCQGCGSEVWIPRVKFTKNMKEIIKKTDNS